MGGDPAFLHEALEPRIKGAVVHGELLFRLPFNKLGNSEGVIGGHLQTAKNENFERSLQELQSFRWGVYGRHATYTSTAVVRQPRRRADAAAARHGWYNRG